MANINPVDGFTAVLNRPMAATPPRINVDFFMTRGPYEAASVATFGFKDPLVLFLASLGAEIDQLQRDVIRASRRLALSLAEYADHVAAHLDSDGNCPMGDSTARDIVQYAECLRTKRADYYSLAGTLAGVTGMSVRKANRLPTLIGEAVTEGVDLSTPERFFTFVESAAVQAEVSK